MEESVVEEEDEGVFRDEVEHSEAAGFLTTLMSGLRERSANFGKTDEEISFEGYVETNLVSDTETKSRDGDRYGRPGGGT
jgi:hypothetical protein